MASPGYTKKPCPGCKDASYQRKTDEVCGTCKSLLGFARATMSQARKNRELVVVSLPAAMHSTPHIDDGHRIAEFPQYEEPLDHFRAAIETLFCCFKEINFSQLHQMHMQMSDTIDPFMHISPRYMVDYHRDGQPEPAHCLSNSGTCRDRYFLVPSTFAPAISLLIRSLAEVSHYRYEEGKHAGQSLLLGLAAGETSIEKYNQATVQQTPWPKMGKTENELDEEKQKKAKNKKKLKRKR